MNKEDIQAALEALGKGGIHVAGDLVIEKHVEHEVANVEAGGIGIQIVNGKAPKAEGNPQKTEKKSAGAKPDKPRETMTFKRKGSVTEGHLTLLFMKLTKENWIEGEEPHFKALFSGKRDADCQLTWTGEYGKGTLVELFKRLIESGTVLLPEGFTLPAILEGHFTDNEGVGLTGLDKGNAANQKSLPLIQECVKLLKTAVADLLNGGYPDDEDFPSEYDSYDHQDLRLHRR